MNVITNQSADNDLKTYIKCMTQPGGSSACYVIECRHGLDGYTPEHAMIGLKAISEGREPHAEIESYCYESQNDIQAAAGGMTQTAIEC